MTKNIAPKKCDVCNNDIYASKNNENLYDGFICTSTNKFVCNGCKMQFHIDKNYGKYGAEHRGKFQEMPVNVVQLPTPKKELSAADHYRDKLQRIFELINPDYPKLINYEFINPEELKIYPNHLFSSFRVDENNPIVCDGCGELLQGNGIGDTAYFFHDKPNSLKIYCSINNCYKDEINSYDYYNQRYGYLNKIQLDRSLIDSKSKVPTPHRLVFSMLYDSDKYMLNDYVPNGIKTVSELKKLDCLNGKGGGTSIKNGWHEYNNLTIKWSYDIGDKPQIKLTPAQVLKVLNEILAKSPVQEKIQDPVIVVKQATYITPDMVVPAAIYAAPSEAVVLDHKNKPRKTTPKKELGTGKNPHPIKKYDRKKRTFVNVAEASPKKELRTEKEPIWKITKDQLLMHVKPESVNDLKDFIKHGKLNQIILIEHNVEKPKCTYCDEFITGDTYTRHNEADLFYLYCDKCVDEFEHFKNVKNQVDTTPEQTPKMELKPGLATPKITDTYPGGKSASGTPQFLINQIPPVDCIISGFLGHCGVLKNIKPAKLMVGIDLNNEVINTWAKERSDVKLITGNFLDQTQWINPVKHGKTLVFLDPPYLLNSRTSQKKIYDFEFETEEMHTELLKKVVKFPCYVMITHYENKLYDKLLLPQGFRKITFNGQTRAGRRPEALYLNYPEPTELHDYRFFGTDYRDRFNNKKMLKRLIKQLENMPPLRRNYLINAVQQNFLNIGL